MAGALYNKSATGTGNTGTPDTFTVPFSGIFTFTLQGANGTYGSNVNSSSGTTYSGRGGYAARVTTRPMVLREGDELVIILAQPGTNTRTSVTDGAGGGSGGASWILKKIASVQDSRIQFTMGGQAYEVLACAAGGCGTQDKAYKKTNYNANDAAPVLVSLESFVAASGRSINIAQSQGNFNGATYSRNSNYGYGGYGLGQAVDDNASQAGGWSTYSGTGSAGASGTTYGTMSTSFSQSGGTIEILQENSVGQVMIDGEEAIIIDNLFFDSANVAPNPVTANASLAISAGVTSETRMFKYNKGVTMGRDTSIAGAARQRRQILFEP